MITNPGNPYDQASASPPEDYANPYLGARETASSPDLDAGAPSLRTAEQQRVNRKALVFLAGIVGLLALLALVVFKNATSKESDAKPAEEQVSVPTLNDANTPQLPSDVIAAQAAAEPIPLQGQDTQALSPPVPMLPPEEPRTVYVDSTPAGPRAPTLLERRMGTAGQDGAGAIAGAPAMGASSESAYVQQQLGQMGLAQQPAAAQVEDRRPKASSAQFLRSPDALLVRGTYLRCVLESHIVTDVAGYTSCILTEPVYSINGRSRLLERGSKIYGAYNRAPKGNRVEVIWDRITTPTGVDVSMSSPGVDGLGGAGHPGERNSHWASRITAALLVSMLSDVFKYQAAQHGPPTTAISQGVVVESPFESNTARTLDRFANMAADEAMSRPPTVTINQGTLVNVYVARDIDFSQVLRR